MTLQKDVTQEIELHENDSTIVRKVLLHLYSSKYDEAVSVPVADLTGDTSKIALLAKIIGYERLATNVRLYSVADKHDIQDSKEIASHRSRLLP